MNTLRHLDLTIIMPVAPGANPKPAIRAIERAIPKGVTAELITVTGRHPTRQRNLAAFRANGRILWFLDHDSIPSADAARLLLREFRNPDVAVAGGPNLAAPARNPFERRAADAIASAWGSPFVTDRYRSRGEARPGSERSLILCNLMVRREAFTEAGGFDPRLYPNEENELLNRISLGGARLVHVPGAVVRKPRPGSAGVMVREAWRYGIGRARQVWVSPRESDAKLLVGAMIASLLAPVLAIAAIPAYLVYAAFILDLPGAGWFMARPWIGFLRLGAYAAGLAWGFMTQWRNRQVRLSPLPVAFRRMNLRSFFFASPSSSSFDLGSITMKGAFRHA